MKNGLQYFAAVLCLLLVILIAGCGRDSTTRDDIAPSAPVWVPRYADDAYAQQGIRPEPVTNARDHWVRLEWFANPETDVVTYRVWRNSETESNPLRRHFIKDLHLGTDLAEGQSRYSWIDRGDDPVDETSNNLDPDVTTGQSRGYYWELQAIDSATNRSPLSPRLYYRLLANPSQLSVTGDSTYTLSYAFTPNSNDDVPLYDMVRVYPRAYGLDSMVWYSNPPIRRYDAIESLALPFFRPLVRDCTYVCQVSVLCNRPNPAHTDSLAGAAAFTTFTFH